MELSAFMAQGLSVLLTGLLGAAPAAANGDLLYLVCPCVLESDGTTVSLTAGARSYRSSASGPVVIGIRRVSDRRTIARVTLTESLAASATLAPGTLTSGTR